MGWGNSTNPPVTVALPLTESAVIVLDEHEPTPARGVDKLPLIVVFDLLSVRFPFVPTLPPELWKAGVPEPEYWLES